MINVPAFALVYGLTAWINATGMVTPVYPTTKLEVRIALPAGFVEDMHRCHDMKGHPRIPDDRVLEIAEELLGMYCEDRITIAERVDLSTTEGQTVMVHELVHWLQDHNGAAEEAPCVAALEREAYAVHHQWQAEMGLPIFPDPFTVHIRSMCGPEAHP